MHAYNNLVQIDPFNNNLDPHLLKGMVSVNLNSSPLTGQNRSNMAHCYRMESRLVEYGTF